MTMRQITHASLFSGIGGAEIAADWAGWQNLFHCEINPFCRRVLEYHYPNSKSYDNITETDFTPWRGKVTVLTGGFPCQPFSLAGRRKGADDDRYLWPQMLRAIREIQPAWVVGENVNGIRSMVQSREEAEMASGGMLFRENHLIRARERFAFEEVCGSLEREGYFVQAFVIPACAVGAPHRRDRVWFVAHASHARLEEMFEERKDRVFPIGTATDTQCGGRNEVHPQAQPEQPDGEKPHGIGGERIASDTQCLGRLEVGNENKDACESQGERKPCPTDSSQDWWRGFPTQSPVCGGDDGLPERLDGITFPRWRMESIKAYGNAWVPQVAYEIFHAVNIILKKTI